MKRCTQPYTFLATVYKGRMAKQELRTKNVEFSQLPQVKTVGLRGNMQRKS